MRLGVFSGRKYYFRNFAGALEELDRRGHELVVAMPDNKATSIVLPDRLAESPRVTTALYPHSREDGLDAAIRLIRAVRDTVRYEAPPLRDAHANRQRAYRKLSQVYGHEVTPPAVELAADDLHALAATLDAVESLIPPSAPLVRFLEDQRLDALLVLSRVNFGSKEAGVVKAARAAGIPSGIAVYSWDNLSSKGLIHERPDRLFVWNDLQVRESADLHGMDPAAATVTGAPRFDAFFALSPSASRAELISALGLDPARKTVLYLGSSGFVSKREPELLDRWLAMLPGDLNVIVRPHPGAADEAAWAAWRPTRGGVATPRLRKRLQDLYDQLFAADAVVALNTSAELEAAIVGRPVLTIAAGDAAPGQEGSLHFRYLLAREGGFVEHAETLEEHLRQLERALEDDPLQIQRARFVERFVRPAGLRRPAGDVLADAIEALASLW